VLTKEAHRSRLMRFVPQHILRTESKAVANIEALVRHAVLAETHSDVEHYNPQVSAVHRLYENQ